MHNARISTPTATNSHPVDTVTSNPRSLFWTPAVIIQTRHLDRRWSQTLLNGRATYLRNATNVCRTLMSFRKRWPRFMGISTDEAWGWSRRCRDTQNIHKNQSEPMRIVWKLIGDRLGGIYRSTKKFSTILPWQASPTLSTTKRDHWRQPAADSTPWTNFSIRPPPWKLHMSKTRSHSSSNNSSSNNSKKNSLRTRLTKPANEAIAHPSPSQHTSPAAANPANRNRTDMPNHAAEDNCQACRQHHGSQWKCSKANVLPANAHNAEFWTRRRASALNPHE